MRCSVETGSICCCFETACIGTETCGVRLGLNCMATARLPGLAHMDTVSIDHPMWQRFPHGWVVRPQDSLQITTRHPDCDPVSEADPGLDPSSTFGFIPNHNLTPAQIVTRG